MLSLSLSLSLARARARAHTHSCMPIKIASFTLIILNSALIPPPPNKFVKIYYYTGARHPPPSHVLFFPRCKVLYLNVPCCLTTNRVKLLVLYIGENGSWSGLICLYIPTFIHLYTLVSFCLFV